jgi:hypothetical protein
MLKITRVANGEMVIKKFPAYIREWIAGERI